MRPQPPAEQLAREPKEALRRHLALSFTDPELRRWFEPLEFNLCAKEKRLDVLFPHELFASWFAQNVQGRFEQELGGFLGPGYQVTYNAGQKSLAPGQRPAAGNPAGPCGRNKATDYPFGHQFTLENFLFNKKNSFPLATAREIVRQAEVLFNPFLILGTGGSGKSHLLRAMGNELVRRNPQARVFLGTVSDLQLLYGVKHREDGVAARSHLLGFDYLLLDDLQEVRSCPELQPELITLFNAFHDQKKQMIFTCSELQGETEFLDPKLRSRLEWGLKQRLVAPDLDIRARFVQSQSRQRKLALSPEQILTLAQRFTDFRSLQGVLLKILAYKELMHRELDAASFEQILSHTQDGAVAAPEAEDILKTVAGHFGLPVKALRGNGRQKQMVMARQLAMYLCRSMLGASYPALGRLFGGKDHSTVLYAVKKIKQLEKDAPDTHRLLKELREKCKPKAPEAG